jgi:hypothetical protein
MIRRFRQCALIVMLIFVSVVAISASPARAAQSPSDYPVWSSLPTLTELESGLAHASAQTSLTSAQISGLQVGNPFPDAEENKGQAHCEPEDEVAYSFAPCAYGDTTSKKIIVVVGDSEADMWIPTFDVYGKEYGFKIVRVEMDGCTAWEQKAPVSIAGWANCEVKWKAYCVREVLKLHPYAVVATGMLIDSQSSVVTESPKTAAAEIDKYFSAIQPSKAKLFVLSNIPWNYGITTTPAVCVDIHNSEIRACDAKIDPTMVAGLKVVKKKGIATVIPVDSLFCSSTSCPVVDGETVLYSDSHHMSHTWAIYITHAFSQIFNPLLGVH